MNGLKKIITLIGYYVLVIFMAGLLSGIVSIALTLNLVTVQGPTLFSQTSMLVAYYVGLSIASFVLFRTYAKKNPQSNRKEILLFAGLIMILHATMVFLGTWPPIWIFPDGSFSLAHLLYNGWGFLESARDVPPSYVFAALLIEDICFAVFSLAGYSIGNKKKKGRR